MAKKSYIYDGTTWQEITSQPTVPTSTVSNLGVVQLTDSVSSTSTSTAATPSSVKTAYDLASTANTTANAAVPKTTTLTGTAPITVGGVSGTGQDLSANRTIAVDAASTTAAGVVTLSNSTPVASAVTGAVGSATTVARGNHVHPASVISVQGSSNIDVVELTNPGSGIWVFSSPSLALTNNWANQLSSTITAAGSSALTSTSAQNRRFTGTSTHTVSLPDAGVGGGISPGHQFRFINESTGNITVNNFSGTLVTTVATNETVLVTLGSSSNTSWSVLRQQNSLAKSDAPTFASATLTGNLTAGASGYTYGSGGLFPISTTNLGSAAQTFTISGIPSTYRALIVHGHGFKSSTTTAASLIMRLDGNSGSNYASKTQWSDTTATSTEAGNTAQTSLSFDGTTTQSYLTSSAGRGSSFVAQILNYSATGTGEQNTVKQVQWSMAKGAASGPGGYVIGFGHYNQSTAAAIASISFVSSSATNTINASATVSIYGVI